MNGERLKCVHLECMGQVELLHAKLGVPLKPTGIGIRSEFCFKQIALARFKTDHTKEVLKSENRIGFLDMGLNLGCINGRQVVCHCAVPPALRGSASDRKGNVTAGKWGWRDMRDLRVRYQSPTWCPFIQKKTGLDGRKMGVSGATDVDCGMAARRVGARADLE